MESINEGGKTAAEIAKILASMNPNIISDSSIDNALARRQDVKSRMDSVLDSREDKSIECDEYDLHGVYLSKIPEPVNPNSLVYARAGGNNGWTGSNGRFFAK